MLEKRYFCKLKNKTRKGLTGFDSVSRRYVSVQSDDAYALKTETSANLNGENNYALAA